MNYNRHFINQLNFIPVLSLFLLFATSCSTIEYDEKQGKILQVFTTANEIVKTFRIDQGAFGETVTLKICDKKNNQLLEKIGLRGEDFLPKIDSIIGRKVYIHYSFPVAEKLLDFKAVALGEALLYPEKLKYEYIIRNKKTDEQTSFVNAVNSSGRCTTHD